MSERHKATGIHLNENVVKLLKIVAAMEGRSASEIAEQAIVNYLTGRVKEQGTIEEVDELVRSVAEKFRKQGIYPKPLDPLT